MSDLPKGTLVVITGMPYKLWENGFAFFYLNGGWMRSQKTKAEIYAEIDRQAEL